MAIKLGCIADDFTGATDLANNLVQAGMCVLQCMDVPAEPLGVEVDAVVIALKSRTIPVADAVNDSLAALRWLQAQGAGQIYFKYCSTFDSTGEGNIGPVTEALMDALDTEFTIATPAFPDNKRTVFKGYLFVGDVLLNESGMQNHPLTPMADPNLVRVMQAQCTRKVGLIDYTVVQKGVHAVRQRVSELQASGVAIALVDALSNPDLATLGAAFKDLPLVTAGSGLAIGLPQNFGLAPSSRAASLPPGSGARAIVSGSCSEATNAQVAAFLASGHAAIALDPLGDASGADVVDGILAQAVPLLGKGPVLVYSTADAAAVKAVQEKLGVAQAGALIEETLAAIARGLVRHGVGQLIVAGGETSGACVRALGISQMQIGRQIDPGVPWCFAQTRVPDNQGIHIALKSGKFGSKDLFTKAIEFLAGQTA